MNYKKISEKDKKFFNQKKVIVRVGINIPINNNKIENDFRLKAILPTLDFLVQSRAKIVLLGHLGRDEKESLDLVFKWLKKKYQEKIIFDKDTFKDFSIENLKSQIEKIKGGEILLLDNLRASKEEKENSKELAEKIAPFFSFYINEAFSVSHREHMSVDILPKLFSVENRFYGFQFEKELENLSKIKNPKKYKKKVFILGGAKIATKIPMIKKLLPKFDLIILGGALVNNFYQKMGYEIGKSLYDKDFILEEKIFNKIIKSKKVFIPNLIITENGEKEISEVKKNEKILDISPGSFFEIEDKMKEADFVFFNGPMGFYEGGYKEGTKFLLEVLANKNNFFVAGGGNTTSAIFELGLGENVDFISTGGGALIKKLSE